MASRITNMTHDKSYESLDVGAAADDIRKVEAAKLQIKFGNPSKACRNFLQKVIARGEE